jgi:hypothetical protein
MCVRVGERVAELVGWLVSVRVLVFDGTPVAVAIYCDTASTVNAAMVFIFARAESTRFLGCRAIGVLDTLGPDMAAADTMQKKLNPKIPVARTVNGPAYSLIFTRDLSSFIRFKKSDFFVARTFCFRTDLIRFPKYSTVQNLFRSTVIILTWKRYWYSLQVL